MNNYFPALLIAKKRFILVLYIADFEAKSQYSKKDIEAKGGFKCFNKANSAICR